MSQLSQLTQEKHIFQAILKKYIFIVKKKKAYWDYFLVHLLLMHCICMIISQITTRYLNMSINKLKFTKIAVSLTDTEIWLQQSQDTRQLSVTTMCFPTNS